MQFLDCSTKKFEVSSPTIILSLLSLSFPRKTTTDGVIFSPYEFGIISTPPFRYTPIHEKVVPKSKPIA